MVWRQSLQWQGRWQPSRKMNTVESYKMTDNQRSDVQKIFDKTFSSHMERLVGAKHGIEELPFDLVNLSCLIFLLEREGELHGFQDDSIKPYTSKTLSIELMEMGIALNGNLVEMIEDFVQKGYVFINDSEQLSPRKPAASTVKLIERAFPKMPGMSLVGYFLQTIDEVTSNRKNIKEAVRQFDQTLSIHGVSLVDQGWAEEKTKRAWDEEKNRNGAGTGARDMSKKQRSGMPLESINHRQRLPDMAKSGSDGAGRKSSEPTILSSNPYHSGVRIQKVQFGQALVKETDFEKDVDDISVKNKTQDVETSEEYIPESPVRSIENENPAGVSESRRKRREDLQIEAVVEEKTINGEAVDIQANTAEDHQRPAISLDLPDSDKQESMTMSAVSQHDERILSDQDGLTNKENEDESETVLDQFSNEPTAELVEKRIADFEEDLAKECPMCKKGRISAVETSTGKLYYTCSNRECSFISWGKPHHIVCPKCQNPFLIESSGREGKNILKCPRATCRHWQTFSFHQGDFLPEASQGSACGMPDSINNLPKAKKRVVRKRRVRRKR
jgi:ssDNA-binding Zn-finger/Zn-ribbon topoisomerase 1